MPSRTDLLNRLAEVEREIRGKNRFAVVNVQPGETASEARQRAGVPPHQSVIYILRTVEPWPQ